MAFSRAGCQQGPACTSHLLHMLRGLLALLEAALALLLLLLPGGRGTGGLLLRLPPTIGRRMARGLQGPPVRRHAIRTCGLARTFLGHCVQTRLLGCATRAA